MMALGCEEVEAFAVVDCLYRAGIRADLIAVSDSETIESSHSIRIVCDLLLSEAVLADYALLFLPGGMPGTLVLADSPVVADELERRVRASGPVAAICAAPSILADRGLLDGRRATANPKDCFSFIKSLPINIFQFIQDDHSIRQCSKTI